MQCRAVLFFTFSALNKLRAVNFTVMVTNISKYGANNNKAISAFLIAMSLYSTFDGPQRGAWVLMLYNARCNGAGTHLLTSPLSILDAHQVSQLGFTC